MNEPITIAAEQFSALRVIHGDARTAMVGQVADKSVHCIVTSPPFWGLRKYLKAGDPNGPLEIGQEKTPELYVANIVAACMEGWRVLRDDGTLWLNLGDCYAGGGNGGGGSFANDGPRMTRLIGTDKNVPARKGNRGVTAAKRGVRSAERGVSVLKAKDLVGIPWRVAVALQAAGWYLRSDIIWAKANCMPESVTDRPTRSHEYIFLLSKSRKYFYDHEAIKEPCIYDVDGTGTAARKARANGNKLAPNGEMNGIRPTPHPQPLSPLAAPVATNAKRVAPSEGPARNGGYKNSVNFAGKNQGAEKQRGHSRRHDGFNNRWDAMERDAQCVGMRNKRDVWRHDADQICLGWLSENHPELFRQFCEQSRNRKDVFNYAPANYPEAHFATYPPALIRPCIRAGCPVGGTVLDLFGGSGTTAQVALEEGRRAITVELNAEYLPLITKRTTNMTPGLKLETGTNSKTVLR